MGVLSPLFRFGGNQMASKEFGQLRLAFSMGPNRAGDSLPPPEDGNSSSFENQWRNNLVKDENGDLLTDPHNSLNRWKNYFSQLLNVHMSVMLGRNTYG
jgi:hypothetical protein